MRIDIKEKESLAGDSYWEMTSEKIG